MLAVTVCTICTIATMAGLLAGIVAGFVEARAAIADALAFDAYAVVRPRLAGPRTRWRPA